MTDTVYLPVRGTNHEGASPIEHPPVAYLDRDYAHEVARAASEQGGLTSIDYIEVWELTVSDRTEPDPDPFTDAPPDVRRFLDTLPPETRQWIIDQRRTRPDLGGRPS